MKQPKNEQEAVEAHLQFLEDIRFRNLAIAEFLGWYQQDKSLNLWYIGDDDGKEYMMWTPLYDESIPSDELPFFYDLNMLRIVMEVLPQYVVSNLIDLHWKKGEWYTSICQMTPLSFICTLAKWNGEGWTDAHLVDYTIGFNVGSWHEGLFKFLSDIILIIQNKYDERRQTSQHNS